MTPRLPVPNILAMDQDIDQLVERAHGLIAVARRLAEENAQLRSQLTEALAAREQMQSRMHEARARVESALARLPASAEQGS